MDGVTSVQARISAIQTRFASSPASGRLGSRSALEFEASLNRASAAATRPSPVVEETTPAPATHLNGRIPTSALTPIDPAGHLLSPVAAQAFTRMRAAAALDGVTFGVNDAYRSIEAQRSIAKLKGLYAEGGLAATPGTSAHGWGLAVDLDLDDRALDWMHRNAPQYGFVNDVAREPWHWTYQTGAARSG